MFPRLFVSFALLTLALLAGAALLGHRLISGPHRLAALAVLAALLAVGLLASAGLAYALARHLARPVRDLTAAADRLTAGDLARVFPTDRDEVGLLGEAFNRMSEEVGRRVIALEEDRQQLRAVLSGMVEGVIALDAEQRVVFVNLRAAELLELPAASPVGMYLWEVVRHRPLLDAVARGLSSPGPRREEITWTGPAARSIAVHTARLPGPPPRGAVVVLHDTTELRRLERLRQEFVANVSHELKTPLSVIKACVETLQEGAVDDPGPRDRFLGQIGRQADRLHALILDLLSLARIESGEELFDFNAVSLEAVARSAVERHRPRAEARRQTISLVADVRPVVWADEEAVDTILENLLDNAVKYTPEDGSIRVRLSIREAEGMVEVIDTGIGIPASDLPRVFERFYRVDRARSREMGGTGLGLAIVKHLTQAMLGSVRASSEIGVGTTFTVRLPLAGP